MISKDQAIELLRKAIGDDEDVVTDGIIELEYGWIMDVLPKKYIETDDVVEFGGSGGILVEKKTGNHYKFGSAFSLEENLKIYKKGYLKCDNWDIVITKINNLENTIKHLRKLGISYLFPQKVWGGVKNKDYVEKLKTLPTRFNYGHIYFEYELFESLKSQNDFCFNLEENKGFENSI